MPDGKINKISDSHYVWKVNVNVGFLRKWKHFYLSSERFEFENNVVCSLLLQLRDAPFIENGISLDSSSSGQAVPFPASFRLCIKNTYGEDYWTSSAVTEVKGCNRVIFVNLLATDLLRDMSRIATAGVISMHVIFNSQQKDRGYSLEGSNCGNLCAGTGSDVQTKPPIIDSVDRVMKKYKDLFLSSQKSDVMFQVKGKEFKAHKCFLAAQSSVLGKMFEHEMIEENSGCVQVEDSDPDAFQVFLQYFYTGKVETLTVDSAIELYCLADKYDVDGLPKDCVKFLIDNLSIESFSDIIFLGMQHDEAQLVESANLFFAKNMKEIIATDKWRAFIVENPVAVQELLVYALDKFKLIPK